MHKTVIVRTLILSLAVAVSSVKAVAQNPSAQPDVIKAATDAANAAAEAVASAAVDATEPEPDCKDGGYTTYDMVMCAKAEYDNAELELGRYWKLAREEFVQTVNSVVKDQDEAAAVISAFDKTQVDWTNFRDNHCKSLTYQYYGGSISGVIYGDCKVRMTRDRTWQIWKDWLHYADSTPPMLPEPKRGRDADKAG